MSACNWVHRLVEHWVTQARDLGQRALEMYEKDMKVDNNHERAIRHIANAFYDEGLEAWQKSVSRRKGEL